MPEPPPGSLAKQDRWDLHVESFQLVTWSLVQLPEKGMMKKNCWKRIKKIFKLKVSKETEKICRQQLGVFQLG